MAKSGFYVAVCVVAGLALVSAPGYAGNKFRYSGDAYGSRSSLGGTSQSGPTAVSGLGCEARPPVSHSNSAGAVSDSPVYSTGGSRTTAAVTDIPHGTEARTTSTISNVSLLFGLITAGSIKAVSTTSEDGNGFHTSAAGSGFSNLLVGGKTVNPVANRRINLSELGYVVLNEQSSDDNGDSASTGVNMIHLYVTKANAAGMSAGSELIIGHAQSGIAGPIVGSLTGLSYGTEITSASSIVDSGPTALLGLPCLGTDGKIETVSSDGTMLPTVLRVGNITDTVKGTVGQGSSEGNTTSTVHGLNLAGVVTAQSVRADAHVSSNGITVSVSDAGTGFDGLKILGQAQPNNSIAPNTRKVLPGLGTLWLRREIKSGSSIQIRMIELIVTAVNARGLPVGTDIRIGVASADIK